MRGEHRKETKRSLKEVGSSPHARGTPLPGLVMQQCGRFIPACAGNTGAPVANLADLTGSSPHARGTPFGTLAHLAALRFIPACAGNTSVEPVRNWEEDGSSPHARGTQRRVIHRAHRARFIPACAGNTWRMAGRKLPTTVHPRMRGEHMPEPASMPEPAGSSPHARGTRAVHARELQRGRFIPACAGNTPVPGIRSGRIAVHPRMRGEHT